MFACAHGPCHGNSAAQCYTAKATIKLCTYEGAWHDSRKLEVIILRDALPVVQQIVNSLHVEALLDLGVRRIDDVQQYNRKQDATPVARDESPQERQRVICST